MKRRIALLAVPIALLLSSCFQDAGVQHKTLACYGNKWTLDITVWAYTTSSYWQITNATQGNLVDFHIPRSNRQRTTRHTTNEMGVYTWAYLKNGDGATRAVSRYTANPCRND